MAIFIDVFYPSNGKRSSRLSELTGDCQTLFADASVHKQQIDTLLSNCNEIITNAYKNLAKEPPTLKTVEIGSNWTPYVCEVLCDVLVGAGTIAALRWAVANYCVKIGTLSVEKLAELGANNALKVVIPKWMKIGGEAGVMIVVTVAIDMIVDAIDGAIERKKLQSAIKEAATTRVQAKIADLYNRNLLTTLQAVITSCEVFTELDGLTSEMLDDVIGKIIEKHKVTENDISYQTAVDKLVEFDNSRESWTDEDGDWKNDGSQKLLKSTPRIVSRAERAITAADTIPQETKLKLLTAINNR